MPLSDATRARIDALLAHPVVLFMKGTPAQPRCGFSQRAAGLLDELIGEDYLAVDVLADPELREGIKAYGDWPTIPQLYVRGELVGGSDIVAQMAASGELHRLLGVPEPDRTPPEIHVSEAAARAIRAGMEDADGLALHLRIDRNHSPRFELAEAEGHEIVAEAAGIRLLMDPGTARRARGMVIDWQDSLSGSGLSIHLPEAPPPVTRLSVTELAGALAAGTAPRIVDVRPEPERQRVPFPAPHWSLTELQGELARLPRDTPLAVLCHHGVSSRAFAEQLRSKGYTRVANIEGGIDAWSRQVDASVPRY